MSVGSHCTLRRWAEGSTPPSPPDLKLPLESSVGSLKGLSPKFTKPPSIPYLCLPEDPAHSPTALPQFPSLERRFTDLGCLALVVGINAFRKDLI